MFILFLFGTRPTSAFSPGFISAGGGYPVSDIANTAQDTSKNIWDYIKEAGRQASAVTFNEIIGTLVKQAAYDTARYIATGDKGQSPLLTGNLGNHLERTASAAYGNYLDSMSKEVWGRSLCDNGPLFTAELTIALKEVDRPKDIRSTCSISQIRQNIGQYRENFEQNGFKAIADFNTTLKPESSEFGIYLSAFTGAQEKKFGKKESEKFRKEVEGEYESVKTKVTGDTKTPAKNVEEASKGGLKSILDSAQHYTGSLLADASKIFFKTLLSEWLKKTFVQGIIPPQGGSSGSGQSASQLAKKYYESVRNISFGTGKELNVVQDLSIREVLDGGMKRAVLENKSVSQALLDGDLNGSWHVGFTNNVSTGEEPDFESGYPYSHLIELRRNRILPVGWELAAQTVKRLGRPYPLQSIVDCYEDSSAPTVSTLPASCVPEGETENPFYHLIDPGWVLTATPSFCVKEGYTNYELSIAGAPSLDTATRAKVCIDNRSCLVEDEKGNCKQYGYCVEDENVYKLSGDTCSEEFASCTSYTSSDGKNVSYLSSTLDSSGCTPGSEGCLWYCTTGSVDGWACSNSPDPTFKNRVFFDDDVEDCNENDVGCSQVLLPISNLVGNGNFELTHQAESDEIADGWDAKVTSDPPHVFLGNKSLVVEGRIEHKVPNVTPLKYRKFALQFSAMSDTLTTMTATLKGGVDRPEGPSLAPFGIAPSWQTYTLEYLFETSEPELSIVFEPPVGETIYLDAVQVVEGGSPASFQDYGDESVQLSMKLNKTCLGGITDGQACQADSDCGGGSVCALAAACSVSDVGCQWYAPIDGGERIPGKINPSIDPNDPNDSCSKENGNDVDLYSGSSCNVCPTDKIGCQSFLRTPSPHYFPDPSKHESRQEGNVNFIADSGEQCNAADVFCEEYTNLDKVSEGGEGREYYTSLRACVKPETPNVRTYYRWVGDDVRGYQLISEEFLKSDRTGAPCTHAAMSADGVVTCNDAGYPGPENIDCGPNEDDLFNRNPDCVEYFDSAGVASYRYRSKTVIASEDCHPLRNTLDDQIYMAIPKESRSCSAASVGCREFKGASYDIQTILEQDFNDGTVWNAISGTVVSSTETPLLTGRSMKIDAGGGNTAEATEVITDELGTSPQLQQSYLLRFWAKGSDTNARVSAFLNDEATGSFGSALLPQDWQQIVLGPLRLNRAKLPSEILHLKITGGFAIKMTVDELTLEENNNLYVRFDTVEECEDQFVGCRGFRDDQNEIIGIKSFEKICDEKNVGCTQLFNTHNSSHPYEQTFDQGLYRGTEVDDIVIPADEPILVLNRPENLCDKTFEGCRLLGKPSFDVEGNLGTFEDAILIDDPDRYTGEDGILCRGEAFMCRSYTVNDEQQSTVLFRDPGNGVCEFRAGNSVETSGWYKKESKSATPDCPVTYPGFYGNPTGKSCVEVCTLGDSDKLGTSCRVDANCGQSGKCGDPLVQTKAKVGNSCENDEQCGAGDAMKCQYWAGSCASGESQCTQFLEPQGLNHDNGLKNPDFARVNEADPDYPAFWNDLSPLTKAIPPGGYNPDGPAPRLRSKVDWSVIPGTSLSQKNVEIEAHTYYKVGAKIQHRDVDPTPAENFYPAPFHMAVYNCKDQNGNVLGEGPETLQKVGLEPIDQTMSGQNVFSHNRPFDDISLYMFDEAEVDRPIIKVPQWVDGRFYSGDARSCDVFFGFWDYPSPITDDHVGWIYEVELKKIDDVYAVKNEQIDATSCQQNVNTDEGCLLFNDTSDPARTSSTAATYEAGGGSPLKAPDGGVVCDAMGYQNICNANVVLKAERDRSCKEWLACTTSQRVYNQTTNKFDSICYDFGRCSQMGPNGECLQWETPPNEAVENAMENYQSRVGFSGMESGYAVPGVFDLSLLAQEEYPIVPDVNTRVQCSDNEGCALDQLCQPLNLTKPTSTLTCLGGTNDGLACLTDNDCTGGGNCDNENISYCVGREVNLTRFAGTCIGGDRDREYCSTDLDCERGSCDLNQTQNAGVDGQSCTSDSECGQGQVCRVKCAENDQGCDYDGSETTPGVCVIPKFCRAYPSPDAPFPSGCTRRADNTGFDCDCSFQKATYANGDQRFVGFDAVPSEECEYQGGEEGEPIIVESDTCNPRAYPKKVVGGTTEVGGDEQVQTFNLTKREKFQGYRGFCLDQNMNKTVNGNPNERACITSFPLDGIKGETNFLNNDPGAEFIPPNGHDYYCIGKVDPEDGVTLTEFSGPKNAAGQPYTNVSCTHVSRKCENEANGHWCVAPGNALINGFFEVADTSYGDQIFWNYSGTSPINRNDFSSITIVVDTAANVADASGQQGCGDDGLDDGWAGRVSEIDIEIDQRNLTFSSETSFGCSQTEKRCNGGDYDGDVCDPIGNPNYCDPGGGTCADECVEVGGKLKTTIYFDSGTKNLTKIGVQALDKSGSGAFKITGISAYKNIALSLGNEAFWKDEATDGPDGTDIGGDRCTDNSCNDNAGGHMCIIPDGDWFDPDDQDAYFEVADEGESGEVCYKYLGFEVNNPGPDLYDYQIEKIRWAIDSDYNLASPNQGCGNDGNDDGWEASHARKWREMINEGDRDWSSGFKWYGSGKNDDGAIEFSAHFDGEGKLTHMCLKAKDNHDSGAFRMEDIVIIPAASCRFIADITPIGDGRTFSKTDVIDDGREGETGTPIEISRVPINPVLDPIKYGDDCVPYGAIAQDPLPAQSGDPGSLVAVPINRSIPTPACYNFMTFADYIDEHTLKNNLFAYFEKWTFEPSDFTYTDNGTINNRLAGFCPTVASTIPSGEGFEEENAGAPRARDCSNSGDGYISVNGISGAQTISGKGFVNAVVTFFGYNDNGNQMPLREIKIDWGDGAESTFPGVFSNRREHCDGRRFGNRVGSCRAEPFSFSHTYQQSPRSPRRGPIVTVTDNWGRFTLVEWPGTIRVD